MQRSASTRSRGRRLSFTPPRMLFSGGPAIQPLTSASGDFLRSGGFLTPRGALTIGRSGQVAEVEDGNVAVELFVARDKLQYVRVADYGLGGILTEQPAQQP